MICASYVHFIIYMLFRATGMKIEKAGKKRISNASTHFYLIHLSEDGILLDERVFGRRSEVIKFTAIAVSNLKSSGVSVMH